MNNEDFIKMQIINSVDSIDRVDILNSLELIPLDLESISA